MRVALVGPTIEENLSIAYLAGALHSAGHEVQVVSFVRDGDADEVARTVASRQPDVVGLSMTFQNRARGYLHLAQRLREHGFDGHLTAGGHFASVAAESVLRDHPALDSIIRGEAEGAIVALADALTRGHSLAAVAGMVARDGAGLLFGPRPEKELDLDRLPMPLRDGAPATQLGIASAPMVASRGCRASCSFCSIATFSRLSVGPRRRARSVEAIAAEMATLWREQDVRCFVFHDDDFFAGPPEEDRQRFAALRAEMAKQGLPRVALVVKARPDDIHEETLIELEKAGLVRLFLGVETDAVAGQRALGRALDPADNRRALSLLHRHGVFVCSNLLLWEPDTSLDDLRANLELMAAFPEQLFNLARTEPYEGAAMTRRLERQGRLLGDYLGRDYLVADPRAELAWRIFRVVLGERCYPLHGVVNRAMGLACDAAMLRHFQPSPQTEQLVAEVAALVRRQADSTRGWLGRIIDYAATCAIEPSAELMLHALDLARAVRAEDTELLADMAALSSSLEQQASSLEQQGSDQPAGERLSTRRPRQARSANMGLALAAAAASAVGCDRSGGPVDAGTPVTVPSATTNANGSDDGPDEIAFDQSVVLTLSTDEGGWQQCEGGPLHATAYRASTEIREPSTDASFERIEASDGIIQELYVAPDGRRARFVWRPGKGRGRQRVVAVYKRPELQGTLRQIQLAYQYGDGTATLGPEPQPEPKCSMICDMAAPPPDTLLQDAGPVVFWRGAYEPTEGWAQGFRVGFALRDTAVGELVGKPEVSCSTGTVSEPIPATEGYHAPGQPSDMPPVRDRFEVRFDPRPKDASGRLKAGDHRCLVKYRLRQGSKEVVHQGALDLRVETDGTVRLAPGATGGKGSMLRKPAGAPGGATYPELPLPLRYGLSVELSQDRGDALLLRANCPAAASLGPPTYRWSTPAGEIEPLPDGRALWRPLGPRERAVAICAVQCLPYDLQVTSYRPT